MLKNDRNAHRQKSKAKESEMVAVHQAGYATVISITNNIATITP